MLYSKVILFDCTLWARATCFHSAVRLGRLKIYHIITSPLSTFFWDRERQLDGAACCGVSGVSPEALHVLCTLRCYCVSLM